MKGRLCQTRGHIIKGFKGSSEICIREGYKTVKERKCPCKKECVQPLDIGMYLFQFKAKRESSRYNLSQQLHYLVLSLLQILVFNTKKLTKKLSDCSQISKNWNNVVSTVLLLASKLVTLKVNSYMLRHIVFGIITLPVQNNLWFLHTDSYLSRFKLRFQRTFELLEKNLVHLTLPTEKIHLKQNNFQSTLGYSK